MVVGTKIAIGMTALSIFLGSAYAIQVPKLDNRIQVLEHTVTQERQAKEQLMSEKNKLNDLLYLSNYRLQELDEKNSSKAGEEQNQQPAPIETTVQPSPVQPQPISYQPKSQDTKKMTNFQVTWYNDSGTTKSGRQTVDGTTISVDPNVIPLGTWVRIVFEDGTSIVRRADDTGSAVKGKIIDVYKKASTKTLNDLGRVHNVTVYILDQN